MGTHNRWLFMGNIPLQHHSYLGFHWNSRWGLLVILTTETQCYFLRKEVHQRNTLMSSTPSSIPQACFDDWWITMTIAALHSKSQSSTYFLSSFTIVGSIFSKLLKLIWCLLQVFLTCTHLSMAVCFHYLIVLSFISKE
jgi:hypothetical protein